MHARFPILKPFTIYHLPFTILVCVLLWSCRHDEVIYPTIPTEVTTEVQKGGLYVLCEGNMGSNKARLDYMNLETGTYYANWYGAQNPTQVKELGDVGNDIQQYGSRLYAVINCSHRVEIMDLQARHIGSVDIPNCRYVAFYGGKAYVSAYVGSIADPDMLGSVFEIDTASLKITREVKVGHQPDELCVVGDELFVVNSGGYITNRHDSTVSVIDLASLTEKQKIIVGKNPQRIRVDDRQQLWVATDNGLYVLANKQVKTVLPIHANNLSVLGSTVYVLDHANKQVRGISTADYQYSKVYPLSSYENPYGMLATDEALYITDAKNYVSSGVLHCYGYDGTERWTAMTGDIPGHLCRVTGTYEQKQDTTPVAHNSAYLYKVYEYLPAMGQFVNVLPAYEEGDDAAAMCRKCEKALANNAGGMVTLGGWGGYITFGFDHPVENKEGRDTQILGNAFYMTGSTEYGSSEPGIVLVSVDANKNGQPDDTWYELKGSLYDDPKTDHAFSRTYTRAGDTLQNEFHSQPYYPQWLTADAYTLKGAKITPQTVTISGQNVQRILEYGYVDNKPNKDVEGTSFDISWAVDADGNAVTLSAIDFVRVYNASDEVLGATGELSTEITGAIDLHVQ